MYLCFHPRDGDVSDEDVKEYLSEYKKEVYNIMTYSIDHQKLATEMYKRALRAEDIEEGKKEGMLCILVEMVKDKVLSVAEAAKRLGVSEAEFTKLAKA